MSEYELLKQDGKQRSQQKVKLLDDVDMKEMSLDNCVADPSRSLSKYQDDIYGQFRILIGESIIHRFFKNQKCDWKRAYRVAMEMERCRRTFILAVCGYHCTDEKQDMARRVIQIRFNTKSNQRSWSWVCFTSIFYFYAYLCIYVFVYAFNKPTTEYTGEFI